ncbi:MAG: cell surface protein, partial [Kribbellaceae bacterium]|nr:cell surface protein [Kribbellaceae bacterium]
VTKQDAAVEPKPAVEEPAAEQTKPIETKSAEAKPAEAKPAEAKPAEAKADEAKANEAKAAEAPKVSPKEQVGSQYRERMENPEDTGEFFLAFENPAVKPA